MEAEAGHQVQNHQDEDSMVSNVILVRKREHVTNGRILENVQERMMDLVLMTILPDHDPPVSHVQTAEAEVVAEVPVAVQEEVLLDVILLLEELHTSLVASSLKVHATRAQNAASITLKVKAIAMLPLPETIKRVTKAAILREIAAPNQKNQIKIRAVIFGRDGS